MPYFCLFDIGAACKGRLPFALFLYQRLFAINIGGFMHNLLTIY